MPDLASPVPARPNLGRRLLAEFVGTGLLVCVVIGSGIAAERLSPDDVGLQLLQNSITTVFGLGVLILLFGPSRMPTSTQSSPRSTGYSADAAEAG